ncbi:Gfo/Idh/MocA family protein [Albidovulum sediminicola]|uniref:Gfo/Idh/MocA family oxidoreductase n=1 Tax=Albidovulum sediminicola TaxID=2984331 RepID=A0ABT2Z760_9RHOB|nr:Gfo/Idh/MocA family oxidoreductase [Defluviimonas sp. WL0075]MCV2866927.1 Gfo/Idh/MocA family oxidoreductase [Defluviimonas sp. WL0075]
MSGNLKSDQHTGQLRVASIGLGWVAQNRHIPVMMGLNNITVVGGIDRRPRRAEDVARRFKLARHAQAERLSDVRWLDEVDAIAVATAPFSHHALISEALALGKHVLTEKPFTMSREESDSLIAMQDAADRVLAVVHNFQFARSTRRLLAEIDNGRLGEIRAINAVQFGNPSRRLPDWNDELPLGLFYDESPHLLYLMRRVAPGPLEFLQATSQPSTIGLNTPARIDAHYRFRSGGTNCPATLSCNFESPVSEWFLMVFGSRRLGIVDVFRDIYVSLPNDGAHTTATVLRTSLTATFQHWAQHLTSGWGHLRKTLVYGNDEVFRRFAAAALSRQQPEGISAQDARDVQHMQADIVEHCVDLGGKERR